MTCDPFSNQRTMRMESQLLWWLAGVPLHNVQDDTCVPDFTCCKSGPEPDACMSSERLRLTLGSLRENLCEYLREQELDPQTRLQVCKHIQNWFNDLDYDTWKVNGWEWSNG